MKDEMIVKKITSYIEAHLDEDLSLERIADNLHYSKFYLARTFADQTGSSIGKYIQGRRLTLAAWKLVETNKPIVEISYEAHYNSQQAFTLAFRRLYLCTPQVYRRRGKFDIRQPQMSIWRAAA